MDSRKEFKERISVEVLEGVSLTNLTAWQVFNIISLSISNNIAMCKMLYITKKKTSSTETFTDQIGKVLKKRCEKHQEQSMHSAIDEFRRSKRCVSGQ